MDNNTEKKTDAVVNRGAGSVVSLTVIGLILVLITFFILYRAERTNNRAWQAKIAFAIEPEKPDNYSGMARFTGIPKGEFIYDDISGEDFVHLERVLYEFENVKKTDTEFVNKKGKSETVTRSYYKKEWNYKNRYEKSAEHVQIGRIKIRLKEAEIIGSGGWKKTFYITKNGKTEAPPEKPVIGDRKYSISGITSGQPLFCVGNLSNKYLGSGKLFIVSAYSEGKTIEELKESWVWRWLRHPFCFLILFAGLIFLIHPAIYLLKKYSEYPVIQFLSRIGWVLFIFISLILSLVIVRYSNVTADLIWAVLALIVLAPAVIVYRRLSAR